MRVIFNCIAKTSLKCVPQNWAFQVKHFNILHASVFPLYSQSAVQSWEVRSNSWEVQFPSSPAHTIRMPHSSWSLKNTELKAQIDKNKSVPSENDSIISTNLELTTLKSQKRFGVQELFWRLCYICYTEVSTIQKPNNISFIFNLVWTINGNYLLPVTTSLVSCTLS